MKTNTAWSSKQLADGTLLVLGRQKKSRLITRLTGSLNPRAISCSVETDSSGTLGVSYFTYSDFGKGETSAWLREVLQVKKGKSEIQVRRFVISKARVLPAEEPQLWVELQPGTYLMDMRHKHPASLGRNIKNWPAQSRSVVSDTQQDQASIGRRRAWLCWASSHAQPNFDPGLT